MAAISIAYLLENLTCVNNFFDKEQTTLRVLQTNTQTNRCQDLQGWKRIGAAMKRQS